MGKDGHFPERLELTLTFPPARQEALWHKNCSHITHGPDQTSKISSGMKRSVSRWLNQKGGKEMHTLRARI